MCPAAADHEPVVPMDGAFSEMHRFATQNKMRNRTCHELGPDPPTHTHNNAKHNKEQSDRWYAFVARRKRAQYGLFECRIAHQHIV